mgnify:CR=1 FL=1
MRIADRVFGLAILALASGFILGATQIQTSFLSDPVGPRLFPYLIGATAILCGLVMILRPDANGDWPGPVTLLKLALALVVLVGYAQTIRPFGFILPTTLASAVLSYMIAPNALRAALTGAGLGVGLFVLFKMILGLGLVAWPAGWV